jgi:DNA polymerase/3'-5' exonuclease PolX
VLQVILDLLSQKTTINRVMMEKIIEDVVGSFDKIKDNEAEIDSWIANEYPKEVLNSQLLRPLTEKKIEVGEEHAKLLKGWLDHPRVKQLVGEQSNLIHI